MDIIRFTKTGLEKTWIVNADIVNGIKSKMWIERYREPGEFVFTADASVGLQSQLKVGTFVSHTDTAEIMIVENIELAYNRDNETEVKISGRSFETYLENRIVAKGNYVHMTDPDTFEEYDQPAGISLNVEHSYDRAHALFFQISDPDDDIPYFNVVVQLHNTYPPFSAEEAWKVYERKDMHKTLMEILQHDNLGIKIERPCPDSINYGTGTSSFVIHDGEDNTADIVFDHDAGDIESADYLWSNKHRKTAAVVTSTWFEIVVFKTADVKYRRRYIYIDAKHIDEMYNTYPNGFFDREIIEVKMYALGKEVLARHKAVNLTKVEIDKDRVRYKYRSDYKLGDLIGVRGKFSTFEEMRVVEHVEIEDENGMQAYPTLAMDAVDET